MHFSCLLTLPLLISISVAAQATDYICFESRLSTLVVNKNPFPRPVLFQQLPFHENGIDLTHIVPPPRFRVQERILVDASEFSLLRPLRWRDCHRVDVDANGLIRIH